MNRSRLIPATRGAAAEASGTDTKRLQPDELQHFIGDGGTLVVHMLCPDQVPLLATSVTPE